MIPHGVIFAFSTTGGELGHGNPPPPPVINLSLTNSVHERSETTAYCSLAGIFYLLSSSIDAPLADNIAQQTSKRVHRSFEKGKMPPTSTRLSIHCTFLTQYT